MANINRDYLIVLDAKSSIITEADNLMYYIVDEHSPNLFVNLVVRDTTKLNQYVEVHDPANYKLELHIVKPNNDIVNPPLQGTLLSADDAIYSFVLPKEATDYIGSYKCELRVIYQETEETTITTSNKFKYKVKKSIYNNLDGIVDAPGYPIVIQLLGKLSDIEQYEEDRRANELSRQLAEEQRQARFDVLDADVTDSIQAMHDKIADVENRVSIKEQAVDKLIADTKADIDDYKVAKDQEIDDYKTAKDTEINNVITAQDNKINTAITTQNKQITDAVNAQDSKIDTAIKAQNDKISVVENNDIVQNNRLDVLENRATTHESQLTTIENKNTEQDNRLDITENRLANIGNDITNTMQPIIDGHTSRLDAIEAIDVSQNTRLNAIEAKNQQQDDRLLDVEKVNKRQDMDLKCLFAESKNNMIDVTEEGNSIYLQNSTVGYTLIDEIQGNTMVNCNKEADKELILNGNINTSGDNAVTIIEGVDGGLVDVALEGNTLVNVSKTKDSTALPLEEDLTYLYANTQYTLQFISNTATTADITLGGTQLLSQSIVKGLNRISITTPETLVDNKLIISGVGANISEVVVTEATDQDFGYFEGMKSVGECEDLEVVSSNSDGTLSNTQTLTHEPLRAVGGIKDKYVLIDGKWYIKRNCGTTVSSYSKLTTGTFKGFAIYFENRKSSTVPLCDSLKYVSSGAITPNTYYTNPGNIVVVFDLNDPRSFEELVNLVKTYNFVYELATPTYEPIDYNPFTVYSDTTHISNNSTIPCNMTIKNTGYNCLLKPNTTYTVSSNLGLNTVTTPSTLTEDCLRFYDTDTSDVTTMKDVLVLEGDWTSKADLIPANFSGIESCFEQEYDTEKGKYKVNVKVTNEDKTKENNITFYINEPLRGTGDAKDRVYVKDDKVVVERNCGSVVLDGSDDEEWRHSHETDSNKKGKFLLKNIILNHTSYAEKCNLYITGESYWNKDNTGLYIGTNGVLVISFAKGNPMYYYTIAQFKEWLQQNPTTIVYQLAEPTYEEVEYNDTKLFIESFKNSTLSYNSNVPVTSKLYYSYSVPIVDTVAQTASISDEQDNMIIELATQVAVMEMMLM